MQFSVKLANNLLIRLVAVINLKSGMAELFRALSLANADRIMNSFANSSGSTLSFDLDVALYLSFNDGSLLILNNLRSKSPSALLFKCLTKEPAVEIKASLQIASETELFSGSIQTQNYVYIVHLNRKAIGNSDCLYALELKEKVDYVQAFDGRRFFLCRNGIIEYYVISWRKPGAHRVELVFSLNSLDRKITDLAFIGFVLFFFS
jgi:hypothetical protein